MMDSRKLIQEGVRPYMCGFLSPHRDLISAPSDICNSFHFRLSKSKPRYISPHKRIGK